MDADVKTQEILAQRIGLLVIANARLEAESQSWAEKFKAVSAAVEAASQSGSPNGAQGADGSGAE